MTPLRWLLIGLCAGLFAGAAEGPRADVAPRAAAAPQTENKKTMHIRLIIGDDALPATLKDGPAARDFAKLLPLTLTLKDYAGTEKVSDLPRRLSTKGEPPGFDPDVGHITYYAPWGNLAIFYKDFRYADGLVELGRIGGDLKALTRPPGPVEVRIEPAPR